MAGKIYVSKVTGLADYEGGQVPLVAGQTRVREGHPLLKGREEVFEEISVQYDLEDARSAPQDEPVPERVVHSTVQPVSDQNTASHEGPASVGEPSQGEASQDPPNQGPASKPVPRRGPRKPTGA